MDVDPQGGDPRHQTDGLPVFAPDGSILPPARKDG
jgi:hypothetical protein